MGQYYVPLLVSENNEVMALSAHNFENGMKLMEHSWIGNDLVNAAYALIFGKPKKVAWIGDYAMDQDNPEEAYTKVMPLGDFQKYYTMAWGDEKTKEIPSLPRSYFSRRGLSILDHSTRGMYLINHSRKAFIDLEEYIWKCTIKTGDMQGYCVNPLPLLNACGNGRGGGDFRKGNQGYENVGIWAFDLLEYNDAVPDGYEKSSFVFREK